MYESLLKAFEVACMELRSGGAMAHASLEELHEAIEDLAEEAVP